MKIQKTQPISDITNNTYSENKHSDSQLPKHKDETSFPQALKLAEKRFENQEASKIEKGLHD